MVESGRRRGLAFSHPEAFIAATARVHGMTVCTRDLTGFRGTGVAIVNPRVDSASSRPR